MKRFIFHQKLVFAEFLVTSIGLEIVCKYRESQRDAEIFFIICICTIHIFRSTWQIHLCRIRYILFRDLPFLLQQPLDLNLVQASRGHYGEVKYEKYISKPKHYFHHRYEQRAHEEFFSFFIRTFFLAESFSLMNFIFVFHFWADRVRHGTGL